MKLYTNATNSGIFLTLSEEAPQKRVRNSSASQTAPRRSYIYAHFTKQGVPFYIGRGTGRRAWNDDRYYLWHRYVEKHLGGQYDVVILEDDLTADEVEEVESEWIAQESATLVNWINMSRPTDFEALARYHAVRNANQALFLSGKQIEKTDPQAAVAVYRQCIEKLTEYAGVQADGGLVGQLLDEDVAEFGLSGELVFLDRLTLCLTRLGQRDAAKEAAERYFASHRKDLKLSAANAILKRCGMGT
jgi:hypothetical protein